MWRSQDLSRSAALYCSRMMELSRGWYCPRRSRSANGSGLILRTAKLKTLEATLEFLCSITECLVKIHTRGLEAFFCPCILEADVDGTSKFSPEGHGWLLRRLTKNQEASSCKMSTVFQHSHTSRAAAYNTALSRFRSKSSSQVLPGRRG